MCALLSMEIIHEKRMSCLVSITGKKMRDFHTSIAFLVKS